MTWTPDADQYAAIQRYTEQVEAERDRLREALAAVVRDFRGISPPYYRASVTEAEALLASLGPGSEGE